MTIKIKDPETFPFSTTCNSDINDQQNLNTSLLSLGIRIHYGTLPKVIIAIHI